MSEWFEALTELQKIFAYIAVPSTVIVILQTVLLFFGIGDGGLDANVSDVGGIDGADMPELDAGDMPDGGDLDGLTVFSIRGIVAMLCVGGWAGIALLDTSMNKILAVAIAIILGIAALFGMAFLMRAFTRLQSSGNIVIENAVGKHGQVYLTIPAEMKGSGKINITVQESFTEFDAVTYDVEPIKTGETVSVVSVDEAGRLVVERISN